ncbi:MAG: hypothetical protein NVS3B10_10030 [Polyangiales bacterium]
MFIGHYGAAFGLKQAAPKVSLGTLFLAVQALDVLWSALVLAGVEKLRLVPGINEVNSYDLYYMPYTHGLVGALVCSLLLGGAYRLAVPASGTRGAAVVTLAVFSHWLLDLPMHVHDLPLFDDASTKLGFGLWNHRGAAIAFEVVVFALGVGAWLYAVPLRPSNRALGTVLVLVMLALCVATPFLPAPKTPAEAAVQALAAYLAMAAFAELVERRGLRAREPAQGAPS